MLKTKTLDHLFLWIKNKADKADSAIKNGDTEEALRQIGAIRFQLDLLTSNVEDNRHESNPD